jgi:hypothetical protein
MLSSLDSPEVKNKWYTKQSFYEDSNYSVFNTNYGMLGTVEYLKEFVDGNVNAPKWEKLSEDKLNEQGSHVTRIVPYKNALCGVGENLNKENIVDGVFILRDRK